MARNPSSKPAKPHPVRTDRNAEGEVARLCRNAGASVQRVTEDDHGYDLIVEFPSRVETAFPDTDPSLTRCLIQVKSVQSRRRATRVKLSNALKFAKEQLPCFVALVTYPNGPSAHEAVYLRHIWTTEMAEALKAARESAAKGIPLNRQNLSISFSPTERVDDDLADRLLDAVAREGADYAEKKRQRSDSLGYEQGWGQGQFVLADGHNEQDLQDLLLGRRADLPIQSFTVTEARFGVPGPKTDKGSGILSVTTMPKARCVVTIQKRGSSEQLSWTGGIFTADMTWLPLADQKVRIAAGPIEIVLSREGEVAANWEAPLDTPRTLDELEQDARFRSWMDGSMIDLDVWSEQGEMPSGSIKFNTVEDDTPWCEVIEAIQALSRVVPPERRPNELKISMNDFVANLERHSHLTALLKPAPTSIRVVNEAGLAPNLQHATHVVFPWISRVGEYFVVSVIERAIQSALWEETMLTLTTENGRVLRGTAMHSSGATDALVANEVEWARKRAEASDRTILSYHPDGTGSGSLVLSTPDTV